MTTFVGGSWKVTRGALVMARGNKVGTLYGYGADDLGKNIIHKVVFNEGKDKPIVESAHAEGPVLRAELEEISNMDFVKMPQEDPEDV